MGVRVRAVHIRHPGRGDTVRQEWAATHALTHGHAPPALNPGGYGREGTARMEEQEGSRGRGEVSRVLVLSLYWPGLARTGGRGESSM